MHHRPGRMVLMGKDGEGTLNGTVDPLSKNMDPSPFPPEILVHMIRRYLSAQPKQRQQWGLCFEGTKSTRHTEPPLELLTPTNLLPSMMHVQYITTDTVLSPLLSQWAEQIFVCQVKGHATTMAISKHMRYGPVMLPEKHSILLHNAFFARHTAHIRPTSQENQSLLYANFKMKTIRNFLGRTIHIPTRIRDALHKFTAHVPLTTWTMSEPASSPTSGLQVRFLNTQVSVQSKPVLCMLLLSKPETWPLSCYKKLARFQKTSFCIHYMPVL